MRPCRELAGTIRVGSAWNSEAAWLPPSSAWDGLGVQRGLVTGLFPISAISGLRFGNVFIQDAICGNLRTILRSVPARPRRGGLLFARPAYWEAEARWASRGQARLWLLSFSPEAAIREAA